MSQAPNATSSSAPRTRPRRGPKKATPAYLERAALYYLDRYAAPSAHLQRLQDLALVRQSRLSVLPVKKAEWALICRMGKTKVA